MSNENLPFNEESETAFKEETTIVTPSVAATTTVAASPRVRPLPVARRRAGMFDVPEIIALGVSGALLVAVLGTYFFWLVPAKERLRQREAQRAQLERDYQNLQTKIGENRTTEDSVTDIVQSLERFESNYLSAPALGKSALFGRLNELIRNNGLRNTAGPDYAPLETLALEKYGAKEQSGRAKFQSIYPGTVVSLTVEGGYNNLRRFIGDLENSRQFIVISAVEIEAEGGSTGGGGGNNAQTAIDNNIVRNAPQTSGIPSSIVPAPPGQTSGMVNPRAQQPNAAQVSPQTGDQPRFGTSSGGRARGSVVSLRLELVAYFNRNAANVAPQEIGIQN